MDKVHFILGVHNHQPIGNFDFVFEKAYSQSYLPFLEAMERHPRLHWNMHATGILWEWLENHHPDYLDRVANQVQAGRLEILTGGYYEPILAILPDVDKEGQIRKLSRYIEKRFKTLPRGMWLAERIWEPHLPAVLNSCGIEYSLLDDSHFFSTGLNEADMTGAYLTEEKGKTLKLLPIRQDLRYAIPFKDPGETLTLLRRHTTPSGYKALAMFDDGEKFGLWPETYKHVYTDGWLERFLTVLESNTDWVACSRISDYLDQTTPLGRVYLPTASYYEMSEWTLPAASQEALLETLKSLPASAEQLGKRFVRGGFWRNFLTKYEESNNIHKKMLWVSRKVHRAVSKLGEGAKSQKILDALWAGQCNCAYWHGVFGGLYLPHLRQALYQYLLKAESMADKVLNKTSKSDFVVKEEDFDLDGQNEIVMETPTQTIAVAPHHGGSVFEWDLREQGINLLNVLTRRQEGYHKQLLDFIHQPQEPVVKDGSVKTIHDVVKVKEPGLEKRLHVDWYQRTSFLDHFFHTNTRLDDFFHCQYGEQGDFVKTGYHATLLEGKNRGLQLGRTGTVWTGEQRNTIVIEKTLTFMGSLGLQVQYQLKNAEGPSCALWFGSEMSFAFSSQDSQDPQEHLEQRLWQRRDHGFGLICKLEFDTPMDTWDFPLETVSLSEEGFERTYQGTVVVAHAKITLAPGEKITRLWRMEVLPA